MKNNVPFTEWEWCVTSDKKLELKIQSPLQDYTFTFRITGTRNKCRDEDDWVGTENVNDWQSTLIVRDFNLYLEPSKRN